MSQNNTETNRYSQGKFYKLIDNTTGVFYIGHTALKRLDKRFKGHYDSSCEELCKERKVYQYFTPHKLKSGDVSIILIEEVNAKRKLVIRKIENEYIQKEINNVLCVNTNHAVKDPAYQTKYIHVYNESHTKEIKEHNRRYYVEHKSDITSYKKKFAEDHKEELKIRHNCDCGGIYTYYHKSRHEKSAKHQKWLKKQK